MPSSLGALNLEAEPALLETTEEEIIPTPALENPPSEPTPSTFPEEIQAEPVDLESTPIAPESKTSEVQTEAIEPLAPFDPKTTKLNLNSFTNKLTRVAEKSGYVSVSELESDFEGIKSDLTNLRKNYVTKNFPASALERFDKFESDYETKISDILSKLKAGGNIEDKLENFLKKPESKIENPTPFRAVEFKGEIKKVLTSEFPKTTTQNKSDLLKNLISSAILKTRDLMEATNSQNVNTLQSQSPDPETTTTYNLTPTTSFSPTDLEETEEIRFTENLKNLALSLENDPLTIFNYVANYIDYIPYFGSKKGADSTLLEKLGNDFDQASLLIGLLRVGNGQGQNQIPSRYRQATVKLSVGEVMDLLGVEDPIVAATIFEKTDVPYVLYVDQNQTPLFFVIEVTYAEAYVDYDYTRGIIQGNPSAPKRWIPLVPFLAKFYKSQYLNVLDDMNFDVQIFFDNYLSGSYGIQKPIEALKSDITNYLTTNHPDLTSEDTYIQTYRSEEDLEFLPLTLPFEIVNDLGNFSAVPENLKHRLEFIVQNQDQTQEFLRSPINVTRIANRELLLEYVAATPDDQTVIDSFPAIYDVIPLSMVNLKPVIKLNGQIVAGGGAGDPSIQMGRENKLKIVFKSPEKELGLPITEKIIDIVEKSTITGNTEAVAINTDYIAPPEIHPSAETETSSVIASQKLWKTAQNFLYRLQVSHNELARITGGRFTNAATRAAVFNGIAVNYQSGEPYSFSWQGLRIDSSSVVSYYSHFGTSPELHQKEFMHLFGLQASLDEADIFEDDYTIEAISTVKGLKLINQNQIPGVTVKKITIANESEINSLSISDLTKTKLRDSVRAGRVIYVPSSQFTYQSWAGLVYIDIDPDTGFGSYVIGEGLNGGYTATPVEAWPSGLVNFLIYRGLENLSATIISPTPGQQFTQGQKIPWRANYSGTVVIVNTPVTWTENLELDSSAWPVGNVVIPSGYGTGASVMISVTILQIPTSGVMSGKIALYPDITSATSSNMRSLPAVSSELIKTIGNGEDLTIIKEYIEGQYIPGLTNVWHKVSHRNVSGFVISSLIELSGQERTTIKSSITQKSSELSVNNSEAKALAFCESRFKPYARSNVTAKGIYQLMPLTVTDINNRLGGNITNPYNPNQNVDGGVRYFRWLRGIYIAGPSPLEKAIAAWNWGLANIPVEGPLPTLPLETQGLISCVTSYIDQ